MNGIQKKILLMSVSMVFIMAAIWAVLTYYNQKTQEQYNQILQRYLRMNEATAMSHRAVASLNEYLHAPSPAKLSEYREARDQLLEAKQHIAGLKNDENEFTLTGYMNMIDSLAEAADLSIKSSDLKHSDKSAAHFTDAARISQYISETALTLIDKELKAYDQFYRGMIAQSAELKKLGLWMLALVTTVLLLFAYWFSRSITRPIQKLIFAARELSRGRFDLEIDIRTNDEISFLAKTFDLMRININKLISEIKHKAQLERELQESKLLLKESQLRSLQSQINPHFLFNTLDILSKKAYLEGSEETSDLIASVAGLLRYNLKTLDREVTLREELGVLQKYIEIQKARFTDRLIFIEEVDERCLDIKLPSLTLQPIIENAVIHAVEPLEEGGVVWLRVYGRNNMVTVEVEDNGPGMPQEKISQLVEGGESGGQGHSTGIGISNVLRRLRLFYGVEDVIGIVSVIGQGTKVTLKLPRGDVNQ